MMTNLASKQKLAYWYMLLLRIGLHKFPYNFLNR